MPAHNIHLSPARHQTAAALLDNVHQYDSSFTAEHTNSSYTAEHTNISYTQTALS